MGLVLWSETTTCYDLPEAMRKHSYYGLDGNEVSLLLILKYAIKYSSEDMEYFR